MNTSKLADVAEITSSIAILITLIFLVVQMQQNTSAVQASSRQAILSYDLEQLYKMTDNPNLVLGRFNNAASDEEKIQLSSFMMAYFRQREHEWFEYQSGVLDSAAWESYRRTITVILSTEMVRKWWGNASPALYDPAFVAIVDNLIADQPVTNRHPQLAWFD